MITERFSATNCAPMPAADHIPEDIDLPSCIYANRTHNAANLHHHHHHHISEHMTGE